MTGSFEEEVAKIQAELDAGLIDVETAYADLRSAEENYNDRHWQEW